MKTNVSTIRSKSIQLLLALATVTSTFLPEHASAQLVNGDFETGALGPWSTLGDVTASTGFLYGIGLVAPQEGNFSARLISSGTDASIIAAAMGVTKAVLDASNPGFTSTNGALISQSTSANVGDTFRFSWNFVEQDYLPYNDWAFYGIRRNANPATVTQFASLGTVGPDEGSTINGWTELTVNITEAGDYTFYFGIVNADDTLINSDLWIDGAAVPEPSSVALLGTAAAAALLAHRRRKA